MENMRCDNRFVVGGCHGSYFTAKGPDIYRILLDLGRKENICNTV